MFCRSTKRTILFHVENKSRNTLIPLILEYATPNTTIYSDKFSSYINPRNNHSHLNDLGFTHYNINHTLHFVDPFQNHIHTNNIERKWRSLRNYISITQRSLKDEFIDAYLDIFMLKNMIPIEDMYDFMIELIKFIQLEMFDQTK